jgi:hypothetical protein
MGWPNQIVEATRAQMQAVTKMQVETMDHMMDAWEEQIKSPSPSSAIRDYHPVPVLVAHFVAAV